MSVTILVGSQGKNLELAHDLISLFQELGKDPTLVDLVECELPLYSKKIEAQGVPGRVEELKEQMKNSRAIVVLCPEYNGGLPPVLNNAIAWVSRASEDWREAFNSKPCLIGTHSGGGGQHVLMALRAQLSFLGMNVMGRSVHTTFKKPLNTDSAEKMVNELIRLSD